MEKQREMMSYLFELVRYKKGMLLASVALAILNAVSIIILDQGRVVEEDTHAELLHSGGLYSRFILEREEIAGRRL